MPDVFGRHAQGLKSVQDYHGDTCPTFTWNGGTYKLLPRSAILKKDLGPGGFSLDSDLSFIVLASEFGEEIPSLKDMLEYSDKIYRIKTIQPQPGGQVIRIECDDASQSA